MKYRDFVINQAFESCRDLGGTEEAYRRYLSKNYREKEINEKIETIEEFEMEGHPELDRKSEDEE